MYHYRAEWPCHPLPTWWSNRFVQTLQLKGVFDELTKQCALLGTSFILVNIVQSTFRLGHDMSGHSVLWLDHFQAFMLGITGFVNFGIWFPFIIRGLLMVTFVKIAGASQSNQLVRLT